MIDAPPGAHVTIDGRDATGLAEVEVAVDKVRRRDSLLEARFQDGSLKTWYLMLRDGWMIPLRMRSLSQAVPELVMHAIAQSPYTSASHAAGTDVTVSSDGRRLLTTLTDGTTVLWDAGTGDKIRVLSAPDGIGCAVLSPDGQKVFGTSTKGAILWDAASGKVLHEFAGDTRVVECVAFAPDGRQVVAGSSLPGSREGIAMLWDVGTGRNVKTFAADSPVRAIAFSPDGRQIAAGVGNEAILWDRISERESSS